MPVVNCVREKNVKSLTFFPRMTAPGSPWMTIYFVPPRNKPVGASDPGSSKSFMMATISSGLNYNTNKYTSVNNDLAPKQIHITFKITHPRIKQAHSRMTLTNNPTYFSKTCKSPEKKNIQRETNRSEKIL